MAEYVDVQSVIKGVTELLDIEYGYEGIEEDVKRIFDEAPRADVAPVIEGEWKWGRKHNAFCSVCGNQSYMPCRIYNYCPDCGAKMHGVKDYYEDEKETEN